MSTLNNQTLKTVEIGQPCRDGKAHPIKVVLLMGATGSGRTSLINGMVNYLFGVQWENDFRLQLVLEKLESSETEFTQYIFHWQQQSRVDYTLVLINTPEFDDTNLLMLMTPTSIDDNLVMKQIKTFFNSVIDHIDVVGLVALANAARLTIGHKYIFDGILAMFGKDIADSVYFLLTFADWGEPLIMNAVKKYELPYQGFFKMNNAVFVSRTGETESDSAFYNDRLFWDKSSWDMSYSSYKAFFDKLSVATPKSLQLTHEVLQERCHLELTIGVLGARINDGLNQLITIKREFTFAFEYDYEAESYAKNKYAVAIQVLKKRKTELMDPDCHVTNCKECGYTCHVDCSEAGNAKKRDCVAINKETGSCFICPNRCPWSVHEESNYVYETYTATEEVTINDIEKKFAKTNSKLSKKANIIMGMATKYYEIQTDVLDAVEQTQKCMERLSEIAKEPDPLNTVEYIDLLISGTKRNKPCFQSDWESRLEQLENVRERAVMIQKFKQQGETYDPLEMLQKEIEKDDFETLLNEFNRGEKEMVPETISKVKEFFGEKIEGQGN